MPFEVNPDSFDVETNYRWDRAYFTGWQPGVIVDAMEHKSADKGSITLKLVIGFTSPDQVDGAVDDKGAPIGGVKVDRYVKPLGRPWRDLLTALAAEYLSGRPCDHCGRPKVLDEKHLIGRWADFLIKDEWDEQTTKNKAFIAEFAPYGSKVAPPAGDGQGQPQGDAHEGAPTSTAASEQV